MSVIETLDTSTALSPIEDQLNKPIGEFNTWDVMGASFSREVNLSGRALANLIEKNVMYIDENYDPFEDIKGTEFEQYEEEFVFSANAHHTQKIKDRIMEQERNFRLQSEGGFVPALVGGMAGGVLDPMNMIPALGLAQKGSLLARIGAGALSTGAVVGATEMLGTTIDVTKSSEEAMNAALVGAMFGGLLFGALGSEAAKIDLAVQDGTKKVLAGEVEINPKIDLNPIQAKQTEFEFTQDGERFKIYGEDNKIFGTILKMSRGFNPITRLAQSSSMKAREMMHNLVSNNFRLSGEFSGTAKPISVEARIQQDIGTAKTLITDMHRAAKQFSKDLNIKTKEFNELVGKALRRGDSIGIEQVDAVAGKIRVALDKRLRQLQEIGALPEEFKGVKNAVSYFTKRPLLDKITNDAVGFDEMIRKALHEQNPKWKDNQIRAVAAKLKKKMLDPTIPTHKKYSYRGHANQERLLPIEDTKMEDFLENDPAFVLTQYYQDTGRMIQFQERFGSTDLKKQIDEVATEFSFQEQRILDNEKLTRAEKNKKIAKIQAQKNEAIEDIKALRDILLGQFERGEDLTGIQRVAQNTLMALNTVRLLGMAMIAQVADFARMIGVVKISKNKHMNDMGKAVAAVADVKLDKRDWDLLSEGLEYEMLHSRASIMSDLDSVVDGQMKTNRALNTATEAFFMANLMTPMNAATRKATISHMANGMMDDLAAWSKGELSEARKVEILKRGIDEKLRDRIIAQVQKHGEVYEGNIYMNFEKWDDAAFETMAILKKETNNVILIPEAGDKPLWMKKGWGRVIAQFKGFLSASFTKAFLPNLQDILVTGGPHAAVAATRMLSGIMMGSLAYIAREKVRGRDPDLDPKKLLVEGLDRGGIFPVLSDLNNIADRFGVGLASAMDVNRVSRYGMTSLTGIIGGPSAGLIDDVAKVVGAGLRGDMKSSDYQRMMRLAPGYNLLYWHWMTDKLFRKRGIK